MGLTAEQVIERAYEEILEAGGAGRPAFDVLEGAIDASTLTITLEGRTDDVPPDGLLEFWDSSMEVVEVKDTAGVVVTGQTRGHLGTTAATHADGAKVVLDNPYPRYLLLNGLKAVIGQLRAFGLYAKGYTSSLTLSHTAPVALPTGAVDILDPILYQSGSNYFPLIKGLNYRVFYNYTGLDTPPAFQIVSGGSHGAATKIFYKKEFDVSTFALTTDLETTVGIPSTLTSHLATGLAGHVLMGRDVPTLETEHIRPDPQEPQVGVRMNVGRALWSSFVTGPVTAERTRQLEAHPMAMVV